MHIAFNFAAFIRLRQKKTEFDFSIGPWNYNTNRKNK